MFPEWVISKPLLDSDEGAANSIRLWSKNYESGLYLFTYGSGNTAFPSRQHKSSFNQLIKQCRIKHSIIIQQNDKAINAGVFHNDVISFGFENTLICHEHTFKNQEKTLKIIKNKYKKITKKNLNIFVISETDLPLKDAINSYIFNSQALKVKNSWTLLSPQKSKQCVKSKKILNYWKDQNIFSDIKFIDVSSSLRNGGGPACLRFTIYLTKKELIKMNSNFKFDIKMYKTLKSFIKTTYPTKCIKQNYAKSTKHSSIV
jgi:succinylarginine dihydrolase